MNPGSTSLNHGDAGLDAALDRWRDAVGGEWVGTDAVALDQAARTTFASTARPSAIVRPKDVAEVASCLRIATEHNVPVYPICRGRNWGYGSRVAHRDRSVLLDLSRMDRILAFNEELGYLTVEPGVTQDQALAYLRERGTRRILNHPGSLGNVSLLGNLLDRGFAVFSAGPLENRCSHFCNLEAVTARGEIFRTGVGRYGDMAIAPLDDWGVGPQLNGLLIQSNMAVVTQATLWLAPRSEFPQHVVISADNDQLPELIDRLRDIRHAVDPRARFFMMNRYRYAAHFMAYPWEMTGGRTPLRPDEVRAITPDFKGDWTCVGILHCASRLQRLAEARLVKARLGPLARRAHFLNADTALWLKRFWWVAKVISGTDPRTFVDRFYDGRNIRDYDSTVSWNQLYWRVRDERERDLDPDKTCGLYFFFPMLPWDGPKVRQALDICAETMLKGGFEPNIALRFPADRTVLVACGLSFDRMISGEDARARVCYEALVAKMAALGYLPYRPGVQGMDLLPKPVDQSAIVLQRLKQALDPSDVIAPGRYDDRRHWVKPAEQDQG